MSMCGSRMSPIKRKTQLQKIDQVYYKLVYPPLPPLLNIEIKYKALLKRNLYWHLKWTWDLDVHTPNILKSTCTYVARLRYRVLVWGAPTLYSRTPSPTLFRELGENSQVMRWWEGPRDYYLPSIHPMDERKLSFLCSSGSTEKFNCHTVRENDTFVATNRVLTSGRSTRAFKRVMHILV